MNQGVVLSSKLSGGVFLFLLLSVLSLTIPFTSADRISIVANLSESEPVTAIDDIGNFNMNNSRSTELIYIISNKVYITNGSYRKKIIEISNGKGRLGGIFDFDEDGDKDIIWSKYRKYHYQNKYDHYLYGKDYLGHQTEIYGKTQLCNGCNGISDLLSLSRMNGFERIHYYIVNWKNKYKEATTEKLLEIKNEKSPPENLYNDSFHPPLQKDISISDIDNDNESELIGINGNSNLVWYDFYNSSEHILGNAVELMDETYDVDHDGLEEIFYVTAYEPHKLAWIDVNKERHVTNVSARKLGGVGQWDDDGFKELSFVGPENNIKVLELYQMLATKSVSSKNLGLSQTMKIEVEVENHRTKNASNLSVKETLPEEFNPVYNGEVAVNITKNGISDRVEVPVQPIPDGWMFSVTHLNSSLLKGLESQKKLHLEYEIKTPIVPGSYRLEGAEVYWKDYM